jgi:hypothetical protein
MPESVWVLVAFSAQVFVALLRSAPPVVTKLILPVSRTKRVIACAPASRAPNMPASASNARRHPRPLVPEEPRMP